MADKTNRSNFADRKIREAYQVNPIFVNGFAAWFMVLLFIFLPLLAEVHHADFHSITDVDNDEECIICRYFASHKFQYEFPLLYCFEQVDGFAYENHQDIILDLAVWKTSHQRAPPNK